MIEDIINNPSLFKSYLEKTKFSEEDYIEIRKICQRKLDEFASNYYVQEMRELIANFSIQNFYQRLFTLGDDEDVDVNEMICDELTTEIQYFFDHLEIGRAWYRKEHCEDSQHLYQGKEINYVIELNYFPPQKHCNESIHVKIGYHLGVDSSGEAWDTRDVIIDGVVIEPTKSHFKRLVEVFQLKYLNPFVLGHLISHLFHGFGEDKYYEEFHIGRPVNN